MSTRLPPESSSDVAGIGFGDCCWEGGGHRGWGLKGRKPTEAWGILLPKGPLAPFSGMAGCYLRRE